MRRKWLKVVVIALVAVAGLVVGVCSFADCWAHPGQACPGFTPENNFKSCPGYAEQQAWQNDGVVLSRQESIALVQAEEYPPLNDQTVDPASDLPEYRRYHNGGPSGVQQASIATDHDAAASEMRSVALSPAPLSRPETPSVTSRQVSRAGAKAPSRSEPTPVAEDVETAAAESDETESTESSSLVEVETPPGAILTPKTYMNEEEVTGMDPVMVVLLALGAATVIGLLIWGCSMAMATAREVTRRNDMDEGRRQAGEANASPVAPPPPNNAFDSVNFEAIVLQDQSITDARVNGRNPDGGKVSMSIRREPTPSPSPALSALEQATRALQPPPPATAPASPISINVNPVFNNGWGSSGQPVAATVPAAPVPVKKTSSTRPTATPSRSAPTTPTTPTRPDTPRPTTPSTTTKSAEATTPAPAAPTPTPRPEPTTPQTEEERKRQLLRKLEEVRNFLQAEAGLPEHLRKNASAKAAGDRDRYFRVMPYAWGLVATRLGEAKISFQGRDYPAVSEEATIAGVRQIIATPPATPAERPARKMRVTLEDRQAQPPAAPPATSPDDTDPDDEFGIDSSVSLPDPVVPTKDDENEEDADADSTEPSGEEKKSLRDIFPRK